MTDELHGWADRIEAAIAATPGCCVSRVAVIAETASTQDAAAAMAGGTPGLLLLTGNQTLGRGRMGRSWVGGEHGLAATFVIVDDKRSAEDLSLAAGLGVIQAVGPMLEAVGVSPRLKRPNDVVVDGGGGRRKLAGVLIERRDGLTLIGIGINVTQTDSDWPAELAAVSLAQLGAAVDRISVAEKLVVGLTTALRLTAEQLAERLSACEASER